MIVIDFHGEIWDPKVIEDNAKKFLVTKNKERNNEDNTIFLILSWKSRSQTGAKIVQIVCHYFFDHCILEINCFLLYRASTKNPSMLKLAPIFRWRQYSIVNMLQHNLGHKFVQNEVLIKNEF